jgi:tetratricopeptide (TPR) repeat protein
MKRYDEAIRLARKELAEHPGSKDTLDMLGLALFQAGQREEGLRILEERASAGARNLATLGWAYGRAGETSKARAVLQRLTEMSKSGAASPFLLAGVYAGLDDREHAFAELEKAFDQRHRSMPNLGVTWTFESLHHDPRYRSLLKRMKLDTDFPESPTPR